MMSDPDNRYSSPDSEKQSKNPDQVISLQEEPNQTGETPTGPPNGISVDEVYSLPPEGSDLDQLVNRQTLEGVKAKLELRDPNYDALEVLAALYSCQQKSHPGRMLEAVIDSAVGVGKTYVMAGAIDYFSQAEGFRNFAIVTPSVVINEKTVDNFTPGHTKSLLKGMSTKPALITSENFKTSSISSLLNDSTKTKLFVFTVQSLLTPRKNSATSRETHSFQEVLGTALYQYLKETEDLILFADEHHLYYGDRFSESVRDITPRMLVGLTGTPHEKSEEKVVFRYPLAAAIADGYVKKPTIVGRTDDRKDELTKLSDGLTLLEQKQVALDDYIRRRKDEKVKDEKVNAVMLVLCTKIDEAKEIARLIRSNQVLEGEYRDKVLEVHSRIGKQEDKLRSLKDVEDPKSPIRVVVAVDKLKEGWDVKNVYVLMSLRPSISEILTEQTLGRGLRLPFQKLTNIEFLDTLEVIAHERYDDLLQKRAVLNQGLLAYRTNLKIVHDVNGEPQVTFEEVPITLDESSTSTPLGDITKVEDRILIMPPELAPQETGFRLPIMQTTSIKDTWSLAEITDPGPFVELGRQIAAQPEGELRRTVIDAGWHEDRIVFSARRAADQFEAFQLSLPIEDIHTKIRETLIASSDYISSREAEHNHLERILAWLLNGVGLDKANTVLASNWKYAARRINNLIGKLYREANRNLSHEFEVVLSEPFTNMDGWARSTTDKHQRLEFDDRKSMGYESWAKSLYKQVAFDSDPERKTAYILDHGKEVERWLRVLPQSRFKIRGKRGSYIPDFVVRTKGDQWWIIEVKADNQVDNLEVQGKARDAQMWCNTINAQGGNFGNWQYLLVGEQEVEQARESWQRLKGLNRA